MKMKPQHFLVFIVSAGFFLSACSLNLLSDRNYHLNMVKVVKKQQIPNQKIKIPEPEVPHNIIASSELLFIANSEKTDWTKKTTDQFFLLPKDKNDLSKTGKLLNLKTKKYMLLKTNKQHETPINCKNVKKQIPKINTLSKWTFIFGLSSFLILFAGIFFVFSFPLGLTAFILGIISFSKINSMKSNNFKYTLLGFV